MSLGKAKTRVKEGIKEVQSVQGIKKVAVNIGIGASIGVIIDLILQYIVRYMLGQGIGWEETDPPYTKRIRLNGFTIFPGMYDEVTGEPYLPYDDVLLLIITVLLLMTKKFWLVIGFFMGWYFSSYLGLYHALGLSVYEPETDIVV